VQRWTEGATYIWPGGHHVGQWPTFLVYIYFKWWPAGVLQFDRMTSKNVSMDASLDSLQNVFRKFASVCITTTRCRHLTGPSRVSRIFWLNSFPSNTRLSSPGLSIPHLVAILRAVLTLSPVTIRTVMPDRWHLRIASGTYGTRTAIAKGPVTQLDGWCNGWSDSWSNDKRTTVEVFMNEVHALVLLAFLVCVFYHYHCITVILSPTVQLLWSPYVIGQTIIFSSCRLFFFLLFSFLA